MDGLGLCLEDDGGWGC